MSEEGTEKPKNKIVFATLKMPDGKEHEIPLPAKIFSSGREGFCAQIPHYLMMRRYMGDKFKFGKKPLKIKR